MPFQIRLVVDEGYPERSGNVSPWRPRQGLIVGMAEARERLFALFCEAQVYGLERGPEPSDTSSRDLEVNAD